MGTGFGDVQAGASPVHISSILGERRLCHASICRALSTESPLHAGPPVQKRAERARDIEAVALSAAGTRLIADLVLLHVLSWRSFAHRENQNLRLVVGALVEWQ